MLMPKTAPVKYIESSYNNAESKALEQLYADKLGQNLTADVRVYDKVEGKPLKYVSIIYRLKENYLDDMGNSKELKAATEQYLYNMFPKESFTGQAKYVYQGNSSMQMSSNAIGTALR